MRAARPCPRASWMRGSKGVVEPCRPSMLSAAAMSAARASRSAPAQRQAEQRRRRLRAVDQRQAFLRRRATPARAPPVPARWRLARVRRRATLRLRRSGRARGARAAPGRRSRRPIRATARPDGRAWLSRSTSSSSVSSRMPENPLASTLARSAIVARTTGTGQRLADAGRMAAQQIDLQLGERVVRDAHVGEVAEAGVDAVDRRVALARTRRRPSRAARTRVRAASVKRHRRLVVRRSRRDRRA